MRRQRTLTLLIAALISRWAEMKLWNWLKWWLVVDVTGRDWLLLQRRIINNREDTSYSAQPHRSAGLAGPDCSLVLTLTIWPTYQYFGNHHQLWSRKIFGKHKQDVTRRTRINSTGNSCWWIPFAFTFMRALTDLAIIHKVILDVTEPLWLLSLTIKMCQFLCSTMNVILLSRCYTNWHEM